VPEELSDRGTAGTVQDGRTLLPAGATLSVVELLAIRGVARGEEAGVPSPPALLSDGDRDVAADGAWAVFETLVSSRLASSAKTVRSLETITRPAIFSSAARARIVAMNAVRALTTLGESVAAFAK
jgi:hypothetical protein